MEDEELLYMNDDEMEKTFVRSTSEAPKKTSKKGTKKAFIKANKKTDETKATEEDWDADVIDGLLSNDTIVKALHELEQPDKENVKPTVDQHNNVDSTNYVDKEAAKKRSGKPKPPPQPKNYKEAMNSPKIRNFVNSLAKCTDYDEGEELLADIREAFVRRWAKRTKRDEAKPEKSIRMYETEMRTYFRNIVAEMRREETTLIEAAQQNKNKELTSEAKPTDKQVDKDLTSEANQNQTTTPEAKPTDKQVDKDLTSEAVPKEIVTKATTKAAPDQQKDLREKLMKARTDLKTAEVKGRPHKLQGGLQQLTKTDTTPTVPKFSWEERSAQRARSKEIKVKLQFFMEAVTFDANTPDKEKGNLHRTPDFEDVITESLGFHNKQLFYKEAKQAAFRHLNNFQDYQDLLANGSTPVCKIKFYYYFINQETKLTELATAIEPWATYREFNPDKPRIDNNTCTMKIWVHCKGVPDPKENVKSRRPMQKDTRNRDRSRSSLKRPQEKDRSPPRSKRPHRSYSRSETRKRDRSTSRPGRSQHRDRSRTRRDQTASKRPQEKGRDLRAQDKDRPLTPIELTLTGAPNGTKYSDLTSAGRREVEKLNKRMDTETEQPQEAARKTDGQTIEGQRSKGPNIKISIQDYFKQHVCDNIEDDRPCRQLRRRGAPCTKCLSAQNTPTDSTDEQPEPIKVFARPERKIRPILSGDPDELFRQLDKAASENYRREQEELLKPKPPPRDWTPPPDRRASKPQQVVPPLRKVRLTNTDETDIAGNKTDSDEEGFNKDERDFPTTQTACDNAVKRLKAAAAYSAYWTPAELAHKLQELFIQFRLESQNMSISKVIKPMRPRRLRQQTTSTTSESSETTDATQREDLRTLIRLLKNSQRHR